MSHVADDHHGDHHIAPLSMYFKVYGALLVLTVITVVVSFVPLGAASFGVAMLVALVKAAVVAGYFMHLKYDDRLYSFMFVGGLFFVALFFTFTYTDMFTRADIVPQADTYSYQNDKRWQEYINAGGEVAALPSFLSSKGSLIERRDDGERGCRHSNHQSRQFTRPGAGCQSFEQFDRVRFCHD